MWGAAQLSGTQRSSPARFYLECGLKVHNYPFKLSLNVRHSSSAMPRSSGDHPPSPSISSTTFATFSFSSRERLTSVPLVLSARLTRNRRPLSRKSGSIAATSPDEPVGTAVRDESESIRDERTEEERRNERREDGSGDCETSWPRRKAVLVRSVREGSAHASGKVDGQ